MSSQVKYMLNFQQNNRSCVIVSHSLGGTIVRAAINRTIEDSSVDVLGILFLGTPNCTDEDKWSEVSSRICKALVRPKEMSKKHFDTLSEINLRFNDWCISRRSYVWCFHETLPVYRVGLVC